MRDLVAREKFETLRGFEDLHQVKQISSIDLQLHSDRIRNALSNDPYQAIGATKDMLEATMKTILDRRGIGGTDKLNFSELTTRCFRELRLSGDSCPVTKEEGHVRRIASVARRMIEAANKLRNDAGTGHGRVVGKEPIVAVSDATFVASAGFILAAWLLHHDADAWTKPIDNPRSTKNDKGSIGIRRVLGI